MGVAVDNVGGKAGVTGWLIGRSSKSENSESAGSAMVANGIDVSVVKRLRREEFNLAESLIFPVFDYAMSSL